MSPSRRLLGSLLLLALAAAGCRSGDESQPAPAFTQADLTGRWRYTIVYAGPTVETGAVGWVRGTLSVDSAGSATVETYADSAGGTTVPSLPPITYAIDGDGVVSAVTTAFQGTWGKMNRSKTLIVATATQGTAAAARMRLAFYQRVVPGAAFAASDLASTTFDFRQLATGAAPSWQRGDAVVGADGSYGLEGVVSASDPSAPPGSVPGAGTLSIGADGFVTTTQEASFGAFMSSDKQLMIGTQGAAQPAGTNEYRVTALVRSGAAFAQADLAGTWRYVNLATTAGAAAWAHGAVTFDAAGAGTFAPQTDSSGGTGTPPPITLSVSGDGTVTQAAPSVFNGVLNPAKDVMIATETHGPGTYGLIVAIR